MIQVCTQKKGFGEGTAVRGEGGGGGTIDPRGRHAGMPLSQGGIFPSGGGIPPSEGGFLPSEGGITPIMGCTMC